MRRSFLQSCSSIISSFVSLLQTIPKMFISLLIISLLSPLLIFFISLTVLFRVFLKLFFHGKYLPMSPEDSFWAFEEEGSCSTIQILSVCEGVCDIQKIRNRMLKFANGNNTDGTICKKFKLRITNVCGYYCWEDCSETFDINKLVRYADGDIGDLVFSETEAFALMGKLFNQVLFTGIDQPQWEAIVIPKFVYEDINKQGNNYYAVIIRMHHCYTDGVAFTQRLAHAFSDKYAPNSLDPFKPVKAPFYKTMSAYLNAIFLGPYEGFKSVSSSGPNFLHCEKLCGPKFVGWTKPIALDILKKIKSGEKTTVTAIVNSAMVGSLRQLALRKGQEIPNRIVGNMAAAKFPYKWMTPQNRFACMAFPIDMSIDNVKDRLQEAHKSVDHSMKKSSLFLMNYGVARIVGLCPPFILRFLHNKVDVSVGVSNVPGPDRPLEFDGDVQRDIGTWAPLKATTAIGFTIYSYNGFIRANIAFDSSILSEQKDMNIILESFEQEIKQMAELVEGTEAVVV